MCNKWPPYELLKKSKGLREDRTAHADNTFAAKFHRLLANKETQRSWYKESRT